MIIFDHIALGKKEQNCLLACGQLSSLLFFFFLLPLFLCEPVLVDLLVPVIL